MDGILIDPKAKSSDDGSPQWLQVLYKFGVPSAIAMYLVYSLVNGGMTLLANIDRAQAAHSTISTVQSERQIELLREMKESILRTEGYQRLTCANTAKNAADRAACFSFNSR